MAAPAITSVSTIGGSASPLGTPVLISGSGFTGATAVTFGGSPAASFFVQNDSGIVAVSPVALTAGAVVVTVVTTSGTGMAAVLVNSPPAASSHPSGITPFGESLLAASDAADAQTLLGFVPWSGGTPGILPATSGLHLTTEGGNTLDDGSGNVTFIGGTLDGVRIGATTPALAITADTLESPGTTVLSGSAAPWLNQGTSLSGSLSGGGNYNQIILNDSVVGDANYIYGFKFLHTVSSPAVGLRETVWAQLLVNSAGTNTATEAQYVAMGGQVKLSANVGGSSGTPVGSCWGGYFSAAINGGTYQSGLMGIEIDVNCVNTNSIQHKIGMRINLGSGSVANDTVRGAQDDTGINFSQNSGATGWATGIKFGTDQPGALNPTGISAAWPFTSTSTMIGTSAVGNGLPADIGIDFSQISFTGPAITVSGQVIGSAFTQLETVTPTAAGTTTLNIASRQTQTFTGTTTQSVLLPTTGVLAGQSWTIVNQSTGNVTVKSSNGNIVAVLRTLQTGIFTAFLDTPTTNLGWNAVSMRKGCAFQWTSTELICTTVGTEAVYIFPAASDTLAGLTAAQTLTNTVVISPLTPTATAAATTTLTVTSNPTQVFTGTTTQTVLLPTTSVVAGQHWTVLNTSTGTVTVESSAGNTIANGTLAAGAGAVFTALVATPTTAANWFAH